MIISINTWASTVGLNPTRDVISSNLVQPVFIVLSLSRDSCIYTTSRTLGVMQGHTNTSTCKIILISACL